MTLVIAVLAVLLCVTQLVYGCCPNFTDSPQWQQMEKRYQTADFINADCSTVSVKLAFAESCEEFFAVKWFCAKMCARLCGGADVSKISCPSRHEMFCRNGGYSPDNIDFQCNCVRRNLQPLCKTKWFTLEELSENFNSSCLSASPLPPKSSIPPIPIGGGSTLPAVTQANPASTQAAPAAATTQPAPAAATTQAGAAPSPAAPPASSAAAPKSTVAGASPKSTAAASAASAKTTAGKAASTPKVTPKAG